MWPFSEIKSLKNKIASLEKDIENILVGEITVSEFISSKHGLSLNIEGSIIHHFSDSFVQLFKGNQAVNYLETTFVDNENGDHYSVTMQKLSGISPSQKIQHLISLADGMSNSKNQEEFSISRQAYLDYLEEVPTGSIPCGESR